MPNVVEFATLARKRPPTESKPKGTDEVYLSAVVREDSGQYVHVTRWGRRLTKGQGDRVLCGGRGSAESLHRRKVSDKLVEGYDQVDWREPYYGMAEWVQALGEFAEPALSPMQRASERLAGRAEPAVQQRERIWELARQGMAGWKISEQTGVPQETVSAELARFRAAEDQRLRAERERQARNVAKRGPPPPPATPQEESERQVRTWLDV